MPGGRSQGSRLIRASRAEVWRAFTDPEALVAWLPPGEMTGTMHRFDASPAGGYEMSLFYPETAPPRGKTADREDRVRVRFVELAPEARIVQAVTFVSPDAAALQDETLLAITLAERPGGTWVVMAFENLPPSVRPEDNDEGTRQSLEQLARFLEPET
jgi:uncharacterized protein YndB with AHSA1/START domain